MLVKRSELKALLELGDEPGMVQLQEAAKSEWERLLRNCLRICNHQLQQMVLEDGAADDEGMSLVARVADLVSTADADSKKAKEMRL